MNNKFEQFKNLVNVYKKEIDKFLKRADYIISRIGKSDEEIVNYIYNSALFSMCIKYETFTSEAVSILELENNIVFNRPWSYTRKIARFLKIKIENEYHDAHNGWEIYNSLKHINKYTQIKFEKTEKEHNLKTSRDCAKYIHKTLIKLLSKLISKTPKY